MVSACAWRVAQRSLDALGGFGIHEDNDRGRKPNLRARVDSDERAKRVLCVLDPP